VLAGLCVLGGIFLLWLPASVSAQAGAEQALVIFHRADVMKARAVRFDIEQDGRPIGQLPAGTELKVALDPGTYTFTVRAPSWDGVDYLTLTVEAGKTYGIEGEVLWSWPVGRPKFSNVQESGVATQPATATTAPQPQQPATSSRVPVGGSDRDAIRRGLTGFAGSWRMVAWSLAADGRRIEGQGTATGTLSGDYAVRIKVDSFSAPELPDAAGGGDVLMTYHPERGLSLATNLPASDRKLQLTGQYQSGKFVFYLVGSGGETMTGIPRSSVRLEIQPVDQNSWVADTYASFEGATSHVQSTRFTRR
jgi:hypothetical protein